MDGIEMFERAVTSRETIYRFGEFLLDPANRLLTRAGTPVEIGGRYLDALILLVRERGLLVSKDRLHEEVWRGVPVTDEALSQAIMALRRALSDDAARPRFIETVPRHGYRFVATLSGMNLEQEVPTHNRRTEPEAHPRFRLVGGGVVGAAAAGLAVGLVYGGMVAGRGAGSALSLVLVLVCVSILAAAVSGLGIAGGIGLLHRSGHPAWWRPILGGSLGGLVLGGFARLLGLDALRLLVGAAPAGITGAGEGATMGFATGLAFVLATRARDPAPFVQAVPALIGGMAGLLVTLAGGTLMGGSLAALVATFPSTTLSVTSAFQGQWLIAMGAVEGAVFTALVVAGLSAAKDR